MDGNNSKGSERRVFNYNYRGPIPTKPHCQRSLFGSGKTVDVEPDQSVLTAVTPSKTPQRVSRIPLPRFSPRASPRTVNLNPRTDYRSLKKGSVEKNLQDVQEAIRRRTLDSSLLERSQTNDTQLPGDVVQEAPKAQEETTLNETQNVQPSLGVAEAAKTQEVDCLAEAQKPQLPADIVEVTTAQEETLNETQNVQPSDDVVEEAPTVQAEAALNESQNVQPYRDVDEAPKAREEEDEDLNEKSPPMAFKANETQATPTSSKLMEPATEMTPTTKFVTSLSREKLLRNYKEAVDLCIRAKKRFCKYELEYYKEIGNPIKVDIIKKDLKDFLSTTEDVYAYAERATENYTEQAIREVLRRIEEIQKDARMFVEDTERNKEMRRRKSVNFAPLNFLKDIKGFFRSDIPKPPSPAQLKEVSAVPPALAADDEPPPFEMTPAGAAKQVEEICREVWPRIQSAMETEDFALTPLPTTASKKSGSRHHLETFRHLMVDSVCDKAEQDLKKGVRYKTMEEFTSNTTQFLLKELSIDSTNDLLDFRHVWTKKGSLYSKTVEARGDELDYNSDRIKEYQLGLICRAIAYENVINYSNENAHVIMELAYESCCEWLEKFAPEKLNDALAEFQK